MRNTIHNVCWHTDCPHQISLKWVGGSWFGARHLWAQTLHPGAAGKLYGLANCEPMKWKIFNSGLVLFSQHHRSLVAGWSEQAVPRSLRLLRGLLERSRAQP